MLYKQLGSQLKLREFFGGSRPREHLHARHTLVLINWCLLIPLLLHLKAFVKKTHENLKLYFNVDSIKSFSRGDAFKCHIPQIKQTQKTIHVVNQNSLSEVTSPFKVKFMPTKETLLKWKNHLSCESNRKCAIHCPFGVFPAQSIDDMIRLHKAYSIKHEVADELKWFKSSIQRPGMMTDYPSPESVSMFKSLIHTTRYDQEIPGYGMDPQELSKVCCNRWLSSDHILWIVKTLNSMQSSTICVYLNFVSDIKKFVARSLQPDQTRPSSIVFILNVGKSSDGSVFLGNDLNQGNHWSICYLDCEKRVATYADSLAYNVPACLKQKVAEFYKEIYGEGMVNFSYTKCHDHTGSCDGKCGVKCAKFYPLQTCGSVCGLVAVTSAALACLAKRFFRDLISKEKNNRKNAQLVGFFFTTPSRYSKYLRTVLATWIVQKTINIAYVCPDITLIDSIYHNHSSLPLTVNVEESPSPTISSTVTPSPTTTSTESPLPTSTSSQPNEFDDPCARPTGENSFDKSTNERNPTSSDPADKRPNFQPVNVRANLSSDKLEPIMASVKESKEKYKINETAQTTTETGQPKKPKKLPEKSSDSASLGPQKVHPCPHCSQTCKKLFNLKRHIKRLHKDIDNAQNDPAPGRCTCLECNFKCHKITDLRNHLQSVHGMKMHSETTKFETNAGN